MGTRARLVIAAVLCLVLAIGVAVALTSKPSDDTATGTGTRVAFYGDSYTLGTGASSPDKRWSTIVSRERNWNEFNPSVNGLGFVANRADSGEGSNDLPEQVIESNPEIVFVTMGLNDNFAYDFQATDIRAQITADLDRLKKALPDARFIVVEPFWYTDDRPTSVDVIGGWVEDAARSIGADYIPGASRWIEGHPEWMAADGLHPNDEGYAAMAERMETELTKLGL
ncbi:SGNH/GDSL hydrolase family protein [Conyzicola sp.]|uniref:SGNH/GDSL hydrolase family protein n=1 Tax=Conyzicola sp. TaxID=1969404 RepID=UPI003989BAF6